MCFVDVCLIAIGHRRFDAWLGDERVAFTAQDHIDMTALLSEGVKRETIRRYTTNWKFWMTFLEIRKDLGLEKNPYFERISSDDRRRIIVLFCVSTKRSTVAVSMVLLVL
jgi:hypothetical protein